MTVNLVDTAAIPAFLRQHAEGDALIAAWLEAALAKSLRRRAESAEEIAALPAGAPPWLVAKWETGRPFHRFRPDADLVDAVRHVRDWLVAAREAQAPFILRVDEKGMPLKLHNLDLESALHAADKYFARVNSAAPAEADLGAGHVRAVMPLAAGFSIVELLTPAALKAEGREMGNCVSSYGTRLEKGRMRIFSLRDARNRAHATISLIAGTHILDQCKGRENRPVHDRYLQFLVDFFMRLRVVMPHDNTDAGRRLLMDPDGSFHVLSALPDRMVFRDSLMLQGKEHLLRLPADFAVHGDFTLQGCDNLVASGRRLDVAGSLSIQGCAKLTSLPPETSVGGTLRLDNCAIESLPQGLSVRDSILVTRCGKLTGMHLPLHVSHSLVLSDCDSLEQLPDVLAVGHDLDLMRCRRLRRLPENMRVGGRIMTDFGMFTNVVSARQAFIAKYGPRH